MCELLEAFLGYLVGLEGRFTCHHLVMDVAGNGGNLRLARGVALDAVGVVTSDPIEIVGMKKLVGALSNQIMRRKAEDVFGVPADPHVVAVSRLDPELRLDLGHLLFESSQLGELFCATGLLKIIHARPKYTAVTPQPDTGFKAIGVLAPGREQGDDPHDAGAGPDHTAGKGDGVTVNCGGHAEENPGNDKAHQTNKLGALFARESPFYLGVSSIGHLRHDNC